MPFNTLSVASAVTPSVIETYFSHYLNRGPLRQKPTAHISYHEGLRLIRQFLDYSSRHTVEDLQAFTAQWIPAPTWVRIQDCEIAPQFLERSARVLQAEFGRRGLEKIGGATWWQWRRPESPLRAEWIEMKKDFNERKRAGTKCDRVILYVHGGAYYFGSVDEHRYQMQRHARKMKARVLAPRYRLAPQFPFPCGIYDCIATYFYLLEHFSPDQILFGGDSAGGGMVLSMLVILRDQGLPLPAGTILLSPWVDLTHSFPSVAGNGDGDYIPPHGFLHKPSMAWPPPPSDGVKREMKKTFEQPPANAVELPATAGLDMKKSKKPKGEGEEDDDEDEDVDAQPSNSKPKEKPDTSQIPALGENLSIKLDGKLLEIKEQIQLYAPNELLSHPLVSPVMQPSLGGLPPMLIQVGGAELLHDEQVYLAHKAANPKAYPPSDAVLDEYDPGRVYLERYPPTDVQLQVWEDLCHVPHTLSFTRPAKYMYRSVAQFGAWALAHAQHKGIEIQDDDAISIIDSGSEDDHDPNASTTDLSRKKLKTSDSLESKDPSKKAAPLGAVGKAGDPLPDFRDHMVRQRVDRHGIIYPLAVPSEIACLHLDPATIGTIKAGPVRKWLAAKKVNESRFGNEKKKVYKKRAKEVAEGYDTIPGETPPLTALVNRRRHGIVPEEKRRKGKSWGLAMWSGWGSHHDESTLEREEKAGKSGDPRQGPIGDHIVEPKPENAPPSSLAVPGEEQDAKKKRRTSSASVFSSPWSQKERDRPRSPYRQVTDTGQAGVPDEISPQPGSSRPTPFDRRSSATPSSFASRPVSMAVPTARDVAPESEKIVGSQNTYLDPSSSRPHNGVMAYPFKLRAPSSNPSIATLDSQAVSAVSSHDRMERAENSGAVELPTPTVAAVEADSGVLPATERSVTPSSVANELDGRGASPRSTEDEISPVESTRATARPLRQPVFSHRTSVLGAIGADGMPTAPLRPLQRKGDGVPATESQSTANGTLNAPTEPGSISPIDGSAPFKIRNPVFDPRTGGSAAASASQPQPADTSSPISPLSARPGEANEATKAAPFKLRHTVYDPAAAASAARQPEAAMPSAPQTDEAISEQAGSPTSPQKIAERAMTPIEPPTDDLPPNTNVVMPTVVARRPLAMRTDTPPPPPPKDERRQLTPKPSMDMKKDDAFAMPKSKFSAAPPLIGDLTFEKSEFRGGDEKKAGKDDGRPGMESFITASDGKGLKDERTY